MHFTGKGKERGGEGEDKGARPISHHLKIKMPVLFHTSPRLILPITLGSEHPGENPSLKTPHYTPGVVFCLARRRQVENHTPGHSYDNGAP